MGLGHDSMRLPISAFTVTVTVAVTAVCAAAAGTQEPAVYSALQYCGVVLPRTLHLLLPVIHQTLIARLSGTTKLSQSSFYGSGILPK